MFLISTWKQFLSVTAVSALELIDIFKVLLAAYALWFYPTS
jgi:hypothetical protein